MRDSHPVLDADDLALVEAINREKDADTLLSLYEQLDGQLFTKYCAKSYLEHEDSDFCGYAMNGECGYVNLRKAIFDEYGINLVRRERSPQR
jgi:hypothetical protein